MSRKLEFLLAIITVIFMTAHFMTGIYIFGQIAVTIGFVNFIVGTIRCMEQHSIDKKGSGE